MVYHTAPQGSASAAVGATVFSVDSPAQPPTFALYLLVKSAAAEAQHIGWSGGGGSPSTRRCHNSARLVTDEIQTGTTATTTTTTSPPPQGSHPSGMLRYESVETNETGTRTGASSVTARRSPSLLIRALLDDEWRIKNALSDTTTRRTRPALRGGELLPVSIPYQARHCQI